MTFERPAIERRVLSALDADPPRIPVVLGLCGTGRTSLLLTLRDGLGPHRCQYVDVEQTATTPEGFLRGVTSTSPFAGADRPRPLEDNVSARDAFRSALAFLDSARASSGGPAVFLLDEVLEFRTFENFPGLRQVLRDLIDTLRQSRNGFVLTTRYVSRALRLLRDASGSFEVMHLPPLTLSEIASTLSIADLPAEPTARDELARAVHALTNGWPTYVRILAESMAAMHDRGGSDPVAALTAQMVRGAALWSRCRFCYELRLHRARGYGALKAILQVLSEDEPLTLTEVARRLRRTPGSTKDYLSWLEDVDLIVAHQKRYSFSDPLLRLWVHLHCQPIPPDVERLAREVQEYAHVRLPHVEPAVAMAGARDGGVGAAHPVGDRGWSIVEID